MEDETIEDVRAAYALLHRDMAALRVKADALADALNDCLHTLTDSRIGTYQYMVGVEIYKDLRKSAEKVCAAIANYTGA